MCLIRLVYYLTNTLQMYCENMIRAKRFIKKMKKTEKKVAKRLFVYLVSFTFALYQNLEELQMYDSATIEYLQSHGVKPSVQRLAVMGYLMAHHTHPSVEEIHSALVATLPTLSKATVYNTLSLLVSKGAVCKLTIDERGACYDAVMGPHAHFLCRKCQRIYDVPLVNRPEQDVELQNGFRLDSADLYLRGLCPACQIKATVVSHS